MIDNYITDGQTINDIYRSFERRKRRRRAKSIILINGTTNYKWFKLLIKKMTL